MALLSRKKHIQPYQLWSMNKLCPYLSIIRAMLNKLAGNKSIQNKLADYTYHDVDNIPTSGHD